MTATAKTEGRVALITGCAKAGGIGAACAAALAAEGITVVVSDIEVTGVHNALDPQSAADKAGDGLDKLVDRIKAAGGKASWVQGDVSNEADAIRMVNAVIERHGHIDILVNNAGAPHGKDRQDFENVPVEAWDLVMGVNAKGCFLMSRAAVPHMKKQKWGRIINMSSAAGKVGRKHMVVYGASKAAIMGLSRALAIETAAFGITVNAINPGPILTSRALSSARRETGDLAAGLAARAARVPVGRQGTPEDVARMVVYLASDAASFVTAQSMSVCGGTT